MKRIFNDKNRLIVIFVGLFIVITILLLLIFNEGKKTYTVTFELDGGTLQNGTLEQVILPGDDATPPAVYKEGFIFDKWSESYTEITENKVITAIWSPLPKYTVTFDLDGGTLVDGDLEQTVLHGGSAIPPKATKDGYYLSSWTVSYSGVYSDVVTKAVWSRPTTTNGLEFSNNELANYYTIVSAYKHLSGNVFLPSSYGNKAVLGVDDYAFSGLTGITSVYVLEGIVSVGTGAFMDCTALTTVELPGTITNLGEDAFKGCAALENVVINEGLTSISSGAFAGCVNLKELEIPKSVTHIGSGAFENCEGLEELIIHENVEKIEVGAFEGCENLIIKTSILENEAPEGWKDGWSGNAQVEWGCEFESESETEVDNDETK